MSMVTFEEHRMSDNQKIGLSKKGFAYAMFQGELVASDAPVLPLTYNELFYGYSIYETLKVLDGVPLFWDEHIERLEQSAELLGMYETFFAQPEAKTKLYDDVMHLLKAEEAAGGQGAQLSMMKIWLIAGSEPKQAIFFMPYPNRSEENYKQGIRVASYKGARFMPESKANSLLLNHLAIMHAHSKDAEEGIFVDEDGYLLEGATTNIFGIRKVASAAGSILGREIVTAPQGRILPGITRKHSIEVIKRLGLPLVEEYMRYEDIANGLYEGFFITSTTRGAMSVACFDDIVLEQNYDLTMLVHKGLIEMEEAE